MREQNGPPKLQVQDTHIGFGGLRALQRVSVDVYEGEIVAIISPNGAGKTTLLNAISGIYHRAPRSDSPSANYRSVTSASRQGAQPVVRVWGTGPERPRQ
jgi:ABC-type branched-subunit amino acid transport system ATPase component